MKKLLKNIALITLAVAVCISFSSCFSLDDVKANRAVYKNEEMTEIEFRGKTYKKIEENFSQYLSTYYLGQTAHVVTPDVPLLLTEQFGDWMDFNERDDRIISVDYGSVHYCRSDIYDYVVKTLKENKFDYYCIEEYNSELEDYVVERVDKKFVDMVDDIIYSVEPRRDYPDTNRSVTVYSTDSQGIFLTSIFTVDEKSDGGYFISMDNLASDISGYDVPKEYDKEFERFFPEIEEDESMFVI